MRRVVFAGLCSLASVLLMMMAAPANAQGWIVPRPCWIQADPHIDRAPQLSVPVRECGARIERTRSDVHVELAGRVLKYEVDERFINRGGSLGEADYLFPLPNDAAFQDLTLSINGELVSGETMDAGRARAVYENIVRTRRDPALVEWVGHGLVRARIFPLNPGEERRVVIRFQSVAPREGGALRLDYVRGGGVGKPGALDQGQSTFTVAYAQTNALGTPYSPTHQLSFGDSGGLHRVTVRGDARNVTMLIPVRAGNEMSISVLPYAPGNEDGFALITVSPPAAHHESATPRDVTLVLDVSGSMSGRKIEQARAAGRQLLTTLNAADRFRLIDFSSDVRTFRDDFVNATSDNVRNATRYLDALEANGGTNIEGALREALRPEPVRGRLPVVLFVTDGEPTIGDRSPDHLAALVSDANGRVGSPRRIFTFGLGSDVNVSLLEQLALDGRGTSQFVRPEESVERMVGVVADRLVDPVLTDVRVHLDGDARLSKMLPQTADIFADHDLVLFARYSGHGSAHVVVEGNRRGTAVRWTSTVDFPERSRENPFVARLWATQRVGFLSAEKRKSGGQTSATKEIDDEIRALGERYGIPTEFTSYLVVEPTAAVAATSGNLVMPAPMRRARQLQSGITTTATDAAASPASGTVAAGGTSSANVMSRRDIQFEAAKAASAQRMVTSAAAIDSLMMMDARSRTTTRRVDGRSFVLHDSTWTDTRYRPNMHLVAIKPFSTAYFDLLTQLPELRAAFALGDRVVVVGKDRAISLSDVGVEKLSSAEIADLVRTW